MVDYSKYELATVSENLRRRITMKVINTYVGRIAFASFMFIGLFAISSVSTFANSSDGTNKAATTKHGKKKHRMMKSHHSKVMKPAEKMTAK